MPMSPETRAALDKIAVETAVHRTADDARFVEVEAALADLAEMQRRQARALSDAVAALSRQIGEAPPHESGGGTADDPGKNDRRLGGKPVQPGGKPSISDPATAGRTPAEKLKARSDTYRTRARTI